MTLENALEKYDRATAFFLHEKENTGASCRTITNYSKKFRFFREFFAGLHENDEEVKDPSFADFAKWRDSLQEKGLKSTSICEYLTVMRNFFTYTSDETMGEERFYEKNPVMPRVFPNRKAEANKPYDEILTDEQVKLLWEPKKSVTIDGKPINQTDLEWKKSYAIVIMLLATELRNAEIRELRLSDLDFEYGEIQVRHGKGDKYRCIDFPKIAQAAVEDYLKSGARPEGLSDDDYLFGTSSTGGFGGQQGGRRGVTREGWHKGGDRWISTLVERHVRRVTGVDSVKSHDLRHVGARLDLHNGMRPEELQAKLGHSNYSTTQIYAGRLGASRKRRTARSVYAERDRAEAKIRAGMEA